jgi:pimeloyl-ACP methyl ester carboxylesterase
MILKMSSKVPSLTHAIRYFMILAVTGLVALPSHAEPCREAFETETTQSEFERERALWTLIRQERVPPEPKIDYKNDLSYLREFKRMSSDGFVQSRFIEKFDTRFYYAATGNPNSNGLIPMVDPSAKAVYVFIHGSGTMKSSGRNFKGLMNTLAQLGYGAVSFDLPFHMEGTYRPDMADPQVFIKYLDSIIGEVKSLAPGKAIYLAGHSFGPDAIAEYIYHHPRSVQGAALLSPAGFDPILSDWYDRYTSKMSFGGDVAENVLAGTWAGEVTSRFQWARTNGANDPTVKNPSLQVRVLSGDREEYVPAPLGRNGLPSGPNTYDISAAIKKHLSNAVVTVEKGVGHYLFDFKDDKGRNAVMRELLALDGVDAINVSQIMKDRSKITRHWVDQMAYNYSMDGLFRTWVNDTFTSRKFLKAIEQRDERFLKRLEGQYGDAKAAREQLIIERTLKIADQDPAFYDRYKKVIDGIRSGEKKGDTSLFNALVDYLEANRHLQQ